MKETAQEKMNTSESKLLSLAAFKTLEKEKEKR